jgi:large conductance mechanosensitive channel
MNKTLKEFRDFMAGGNLIDLAVAVVLAGLIAVVVNAVVKGIVEPFIAMFFGKPNFDDVLSFTINDSTFRPGLVLSALFTLVATGAVVYFGIVVPYTRIRRPRDPAGPTQEELLTQIRDLLARR